MWIPFSLHVANEQLRDNIFIMRARTLSLSLFLVCLYGGWSYGQNWLALFVSILLPSRIYARKAIVNSVMETWASDRTYVQLITLNVKMLCFGMFVVYI